MTDREREPGGRAAIVFVLVMVAAAVVVWHVGP